LRKAAVEQRDRRFKSIFVRLLLKVVGKSPLFFYHKKERRFVEEMICVKQQEEKSGERIFARLFGLTHTLTHTGKRTDGNNGAKSTADLILLE